MQTFCPPPTVAQATLAAEALVARLTGTSTLSVNELANAEWCFQGYAESVILPLTKIAEPATSPATKAPPAPPVTLTTDQLVAKLRQFVGHARGLQGVQPLDTANWAAVIAAVIAFVQALIAAGV